MEFLVRGRWLAILLIACLLLEPVNSRRSGAGGGVRGSSGARTSGAGSRSRAGMGTSGGGYRPSSGSSYPRNNLGVGGGHNTGGSSWMGSGGIRNDGRPRSGTGSGGWFGGSSSAHNPKFNKGSGIGSMVRSNTFKNAIVGAAAGYLTYQAGKHLIRSAMAPMMWNNRPYYWGSNYYQQRPGMQMCRMPIDSNDQQFGNIYFQDYSRPKELTWSCSYGEVCCGYECCPASYGGGMGNSYNGGWMGRNGGYGRGISVGSLLILLMLSVCGCYMFYRMCKNRRQNYQQASTHY